MFSLSGAWRDRERCSSGDVSYVGCVPVSAELLGRLVPGASPPLIVASVQSLLHVVLENRGSDVFRLIAGHLLLAFFCSRALGQLGTPEP